VVYFCRAALVGILGKFSFIIAAIIVNIIFIVRFYRASQSSYVNYQQRQNNAKNLKIIGGLLLGIGIITSLTFGGVTKALISSASKNILVANWVGKFHACLEKIHELHR
jgi:hypothetical protein